MWNIIIGIIITAGIILFWIMLYDSTRFVIVKYTLEDERVHKPYRAVVLADLHNKSFGKENSMLLDAIREQHPDGIFVAGDMITAGRKSGMEPALSFLKALAKEYPIYYSNGNHEQKIRLKTEYYGALGEEYEKELKEAGIRLLSNEHILLAEHNIAIYGLEMDSAYYKRFKKAPMAEDYLPGLLGKGKEDCFKVLLAHNPDYFPQYASWGAHGVMAGHIHGGIVRIPFGKGVLSPAVRFFPKYDGGIFREGNSTMLLSRGIGTHTIPFRLFNPGEVLVVDMGPKNRCLSCQEAVKQVK